MAKRDRIANREAEGGRQISALLNADEAKLLARFEKTHGGVKAALIAGLHALDGREQMTKAQLLREIERRMK